MNNLHARSPKEYQVKALCGLFGVSKQAYYKYDGDRALLYMAQEEFVVQYIREVRALDPAGISRPDKGLHPDGSRQANRE